MGSDFADMVKTKVAMMLPTCSSKLSICGSETGYILYIRGKTHTK